MAAIHVSNVKMFGLRLREIIVFLLTVFVLLYFGYKKQTVALVIAYLLLVPTLYLIKKRKKLSYWQEKFIAYLIGLSIFAFVIPFEDLLALTVGSLIAGIIISVAKSSKWKKVNKDEEMLPKWEGEEEDKRGKTS
ncbi:MAG TPA: hypothetical protein VFG09_02160 [Thermodesulfovibrionales bacterium]|nr:hypothetical protein [Thermodesulfovibrionales bacterium]